MKKTVVIGLLGTKVDHTGFNAKRWQRWRPSVSLCQHDDLLIDRFELLYQSRYQLLADQVIADIGSVSPETTVNRHLIELDDPWNFEEVYSELYSFARAYPFDNESEEYLLHLTTGTHVAQICGFLLTEARYIPARLLQTAPPQNRPRSDRAAGDAPEPSGSYAIIDLDLSRYDRLAARFQSDTNAATDYLKAGIDTRNAAFNALIERIEAVALRSREPLLLSGPTGAGKSQLAKRVYALKKRRNQVSGPLVELNCATLRGDAAMSTLFGHVKGSFTGATGRRDGLLRAADQGLLFLDEIGELGLDEQAMLLRALEEKRFFPLGADRETQSDFQLLAGSNRDLLREAAAGRFREDLLARINLWQFRLPGLAERREDIEPNLDYELERSARQRGHRVWFSAGARDRYLRFATSARATWRANFRDLSASVTRLATLADGGRIGTALVDEEITRLETGWRDLGRDADENRADDALLPDDIDLFDRLQLRQVLAVCRRHRTLSDAGRELFAVSRDGKKSFNDADRLGKYLRRFGLSWGQIKARP